MSDLIETRDGRVVTLTLNRPDRLNAMSDEMLRGLCEAFPRLGGDEGVGAIVLTGAGRAFCAGGDVKAMGQRGDMGLEKRVAELRWKQQVPHLVKSTPKVVVAMLNGAAVGAGFGLALACDLRFAARSAKLATGFAGVALSGDYGTGWSLTRLLGPARAREVMLLNQGFDMERAAALGLVTRVVDDERLAEETVAFAHEIANGPSVALGYMKKNLYAAESEPLPAVLEMETLHQSITALTDDHKEARAAFAEKRRPRFGEARPPA